MRCRVCGSNNEDGSKFCWNCGNKLTEQSETGSSSVNQPGIQQNSGDVQHNQVGTPPKQVRMPQRQVPPGGFDWENGKKMAEERLQKGKNIADGCVGQLKRVAENQTITDKLKKISKKTWGIIGACVALVLVLLIVIALHKPTVNLNDYLKVTYGGYDGGGVAYTEIDWNSMKEDFENKISYKRGMAQTGGMTPIDIIMEYTNATSDYLCSYSSDRLLTDSDVEGYLNANYSEYNFPEGINIIQMIINEIYAKHGYEFTDSKLSAYFSNKTWYKSNTNKVNDMNAVSDSMSEIEKKNVDFLNSYR